MLKPAQSRIEGYVQGVKNAAAEADRFATQCLSAEPRDQSTHDMGIGAARAAIAIRRLLEQ